MNEFIEEKDLDFYADIDYVVNLLDGLSVQELEDLSKTISVLLKEKE